MLRRIEIDNYKAFSRFRVDLGPKVLLIGPNNAGKSTLISCLRLISHFTRQGQLRRFDPVGADELGVEIDLRDLGIPLINLAHNNKTDNPSTIEAFFDNGMTLKMSLVVRGQSYGSWYQNGSPVMHPAEIRRELGGEVGVVPPVAPIEVEEHELTPRYVQRQVDGPLSPRHFRNQWYHQPEDFPLLQNLLQQTHPDLRIYLPEANLRIGEDNLLMMDFREGHFQSDIASAGHGVQVWLQILSHLIRLRDRRCVVLDEPDVYLHPDLQRKLVRLVDSLNIDQFIVASHSVDILNEMDMNEVLVIDRLKRRATPLSSLDDLRQATGRLGTTTNSHLARLARSNLTLFVEGDDFVILKKFAEALTTQRTLRRGLEFAVHQLEGGNDWERLTYVDWFFKNFTGERIRFLFVRDRDYLSDDEVTFIQQKLASKQVETKSGTERRSRTTY